VKCQTKKLALYGTARTRSTVAVITADKLLARCLLTMFEL